jgi:D-3-phosphoglycerate dehydrogenase
MEIIDEDYCQKNSIELFNAPEGNRNAVAEHAVGMLLALFNRIVIADREVRSGKWRREENRGVELEGKTVGIIGFGNNGSQFAKKLTGFDCDVIAYDKYKTGFSSDIAEEVSLDKIFERSDVISFHIPQNEETIGMGDKAFFDKFKKTIYVINLARGKVIKTNALVEAMKNDQVTGACLDVLEYEKSSFESFFEQELPEDFQYLLRSDRVILSPHVGGWTHESYFKLSDVLADKILSHF